MNQLITISSISGSSYPYDVYFCDYTLSYCTMVDTINNSSELPVSLTLPTEFQNTNNLIIKLIDTNGCESFTPLYCSV